MNRDEGKTEAHDFTQDHPLVTDDPNHPLTTPISEFNSDGVSTLSSLDDKLQLQIRITEILWSISPGSAIINNISIRIELTWDAGNTWRNLGVLIFDSFDWELLSTLVISACKDFNIPCIYEKLQRPKP